MIKFKKILMTPSERTMVKKNTREFIILHHTATVNWTIRGVVAWLATRSDWASCHYVVDTNWDIYKIGLDTDILWHAWNSKWKDVISWNLYFWMNEYSIWIEIVWPTNPYWFTNIQKKVVKNLIFHIAISNNIDPLRVLRHKDVSVWRKIDPDDRLWNKEYKVYNDFVYSIFG
jgi:N-acetyl-anhydromuramyl-L-alanine amidase AmpD